LTVVSEPEFWHLMATMRDRIFPQQRPASKAHSRLGWSPVLPLEPALDLTAEWCKHSNSCGSIHNIPIALAASPS
jgi:nucleoside-diphosphate-sugar epimerase